MQCSKKRCTSTVILKEMQIFKTDMSGEATDSLNHLKLTECKEVLEHIHYNRLRPFNGKMCTLLASHQNHSSYGPS